MHFLLLNMLQGLKIETIKPLYLYSSFRYMHMHMHMLSFRLWKVLYFNC